MFLILIFKLFRSTIVLSCVIGLPQVYLSIFWILLIHDSWRQWFVLLHTWFYRMQMFQAGNFWMQFFLSSISAFACFFFCQASFMSTVMFARLRLLALWVSFICTFSYLYECSPMHRSSCLVVFFFRFSNWHTMSHWFWILWEIRPLSKYR